MDINDIRKGVVVQHFKRELLSQEELGTPKYTYEILGTALHTETEEHLVLYRALYGEGMVFARPVEMFLSPVDREKYPDVKQQFRFEIIKD